MVPSRRRDTRPTQPSGSLRPVLDDPVTAHAAVPTPRSLDDLYDIARLADRLGVEHATVRVWLSRKVPWLPPPDGWLNGGAVWRAETLAGLEERRRPGRPGPKPGSKPGPSHSTSVTGGTEHPE